MENQSHNSKAKLQIEVHDAKNQRQPGGQQKKQYAKLQSVQDLDHDECAVHDQTTLETSDHHHTQNNHGRRSSQTLTTPRTP